MSARIAIGAAFLLAALPSSSPAAGPPDLRERSISSGGRLRTYLVAQPDSLDRAKPVQVVLVLHGGFGTARATAAHTRFDLEAERRGFLAVFPQGVGNSWNAGGDFPTPASRLGVDDVGFVRDVLADIRRTYRIDPRRVFVAGVSNGGMMGYRLACELSETVAGVAGVSTTMVTPRCRPKQPVSILHIHGAADERVPFGGGSGEGFATRHVELASVPEVIARWRTLDGCRQPVTTRQAGRITTTTASACRSGSAVQLMTIQGGTHSWYTPDAPPPNNGIDAPALASRFFAAHPRRTGG